MKPDIIRQPLLLAIASLLVVIAAAMTTGTVISPAPETVISTPLGDLIGLFQERFPRCSRIFCGSLLLLTGILCGRLAVRYGLYPVSSTLTIPLYGLVACGILLGREYLTESVTAFILLLSTQSFFACFRNGYAIGAVFRASFFLGLLPLLYAPLLPLPLLILAAAFCFRRTGGNRQVILCERGIRTFETDSRATLDIAAIPVLKKLTHLPVIVDPSHAAGRAELVAPLALAAVAAGADGLMVEVHDRPACALSDGAQALSCDQFDRLAGQVRELLPHACR